MNVAKVLSYSILGGGAEPVTVAVMDAPQGVTLVGLPEVAAREMRVRVLAALRHAVVPNLDRLAITVQGTPAAVEAFREDTAVAAAVAAHRGCLPERMLDRVLVGGQLSLDGRWQQSRGALCAAELARERGLLAILLAPGDALVATLADGPIVGEIVDLAQLMRGQLHAPAPARGTEPDMADVPAAYPDVERLLAIAALGRHNVLLEGPPGIGATMLARRLPTLLPPLTRNEALEIASVQSAAGLLSGLGLPIVRPFRAPHHTASVAALLGGGRPVRPGELSLAHRGVLFLDDVLEFPRQTLQEMRASLSQGYVDRTAREHRVVIPCDALVVGSARPCPCGWHGSADRRCTCSDKQLQIHQRRIETLLHELFEIRVRVPALRRDAVRGSASGTTSRTLQLKLARAEQGRASLEPSTSSLQRLAASIAAFDGKGVIDATSLAEAVRLRLAGGEVRA